ncbi:ROK family protein [Microbacterium sp. BWT-B31]|uniref:ROK family protein n=1 Tax=Microbacterium sp. BWT-B31 TaxID=3232072 RepID=UPI003529CC49
MTVTGLIAGVETGGTKTVAAVAAQGEPGTILAEVEVPTTTPDEVGARLREFLRSHGDIARVGVAAFGPLDLDPASPAFGTVVATPKPGWSGVDLAALIGRRPVAIVSDVTGAALGEAAAGATAGVRDSAYITVGTGIGVGVLLGGRPFSGTSHPELGHISMRRHPGDAFCGACPFHGGDCVEGLAAGPAVSARWGRPSHDLGVDLDRAVEFEAFYLAQLIATVSYAYRPQRIVLGGGAMKIPGLLDAVREASVRELRGALGAGHPSNDPEHYLVRPALGDRSGVTGALRLAATQTTDAA